MHLEQIGNQIQARNTRTVLILLLKPVSCSQVAQWLGTRGSSANEKFRGVAQSGMWSKVHLFVLCSEVFFFGFLRFSLFGFDIQGTQL